MENVRITKGKIFPISVVWLVLLRERETSLWSNDFDNILSQLNTLTFVPA